MAPVELSDPAYGVEGLRCATAYSRALGRRADVTFWAPDDDVALPLVILLHGVYGSHWAWAWKAGAPLARPRAVLAMPSDGLFGLGSPPAPPRRGGAAP